jgi:hypothetical protein
MTTLTASESQSRERGPEAVQTSSVTLGRFVFLRNLARIVGPSPVGDEPFAGSLSSFCQAMLAIVMADVEVEGDYEFERHKVGTSPRELRDLWRSIATINAVRCTAA